MIQVNSHLDTSAVSGRLRQRLDELGVTLVSLCVDGGARILGPGRWEHRLIVGSPVFASAVRSHWDRLAGGPKSSVDLWPGLSLVPLCPGAGGGFGGGGSGGDRLTVALILDCELPKSEQFQRVCDTSQTDIRAAVTKLNPEGLISHREARRLAQVIGWMARDAHDLGWRLNELHDLSWELAGAYEELSLLYKLSTSMVVDHPPQSFLADACAEIREVVGLRWLAIQLSPTEPGFADLSVPVCIVDNTELDASLIREMGPRLIEAIGGRTEPTIVDDARSLGVPGLERIANSLLVTPLHVDGKLLGLLYGADKIGPGSSLSTVDSKLCASLGSSLSIYLKNVLLYEDMQSMFLGTLHALSTTIDAKDSYTQGHSERVALMSRQLAQGIGLDEQTVERVYLSGLVHDVGKIGVPEAVLTKPGKLTNEEYELVKKHPETGARILEGIRQMHDLIPGVLHHHESWDGSGYPHGLKGPAIPLFGRIIGLADAFDAMSSDRTYRAAMPMSRVLDEVRRCSGKQFDPDMTDVFIGLNFEPYLDMIREHRHLRPAA